MYSSQVDQNGYTILTLTKFSQEDQEAIILFH
jgi:hypothetical protein